MLAPVADRHFLTLKAELQAFCPADRLAETNRPQHLSGLVGLPKDLKQLDFARPASDRRDVDLPHQSAPLLGQLLDRHRRRNNLLGFGLARHAVGRMHGRAEDVMTFHHNGAEMTADADCDLAMLMSQQRICRDRLLHLLGGIHRVIGAGKCRHGFIPHGLNHAAGKFLRGLAHDIDTMGDHCSGPVVAELFVKLRAAHHVGEQYDNIDIPSHTSPAETLAIFRQRHKRSRPDPLHR